MLDKPRLENQKIIASLSADYGLAVSALEFLPLGYDSAAGVYRAQAGEQCYFLKIRREPAQALSVLLPHYLGAQGMEQVVAPILTRAGAPWGTVEDFTLILYPYVDGTNAWNTGLSDAQWKTLGAALKQLHATQLPPDLLRQMPQETFVPHPKWMALIRALHADIRDQTASNPFERELAAFWRAHYDEIGAIIERTTRLGEQLHDKTLPLVPCHADIHLANVLIDAQEQVFIVDWDEAVLAPRERDLMFVTVGGFVAEERTESLFFEGYGPTEIDLLVMAFYRYARAMEDLAAFAERVFAPDASDATRQDSVEWFKAQFAPGSSVEAAHRLDHLLV
ncbi:phosphotransferase enzyme family protein [Aggregatilinea lenta]|uniref:phosphotransferase enzyme family protein n=1 Tax=Aggregatilinea lenta TaxID=913108 RepID=UPI0013C2F808|nr:phosphotransferase [Aggregatilinea lenta]